MMGRIESAGALTTTIMVGFTSMMAVRSVFIMKFREPSENITRSTTAKIANIIIAIIIAGGSNIRTTPGQTRDRKIRGNET
jgi:predicted ThiF/HesA family dinucleotide-utilizing enzyme